MCVCVYIYICVCTVCIWANENNNKPCWFSLEAIPQTQPATNMYTVTTFKYTDFLIYEQVF